MSTSFKCIRCGQPATATDVRKSDGLCDSCDPGPDFACVDLEAVVEAHASAPLLAELPVKPIDMMLPCPGCGYLHIDAPRLAGDAEAPPFPTEGMSHEEAQPLIDALADYEASWTNPPHRSHWCKYCGHTWRPADVPTNGVKELKTRGQNDSPLPLPRIGLG